MLLTTALASLLSGKLQPSSSHVRTLKHTVQLYLFRASQQVLSLEEEKNNISIQLKDKEAKVIGELKVLYVNYPEFIFTLLYFNN